MTEQALCQFSQQSRLPSMAFLVREDIHRKVYLAVGRHPIQSVCHLY